MEEAHLETCGAITLVDPNAFDAAVGRGWEGEFDEILDIAAVAGAVVGFEVRHDSDFFPHS